MLKLVHLTILISFLSQASIYHRADFLYISLILGVLAIVFGVNVVAHRYIGHESFQASGPITCILLGWFSYLGLDSPIFYNQLHQRHHFNSDRLGDPHSPHQRSAWLLPLRIFFLKFPPVPIHFRILKRQLRRPYFKFFHRWRYGIPFLAMFLLASLGSLSAVFYFMTVPSLFALFGQLMQVFLGHASRLNSQSTQDRSSDSVLMNLLTLGEGLHHSHHIHPRRIFQKMDNPLLFDFTGWLILKIPFFQKDSKI